MMNMSTPAPNHQEYVPDPPQPQQLQVPAGYVLVPQSIITPEPAHEPEPVQTPVAYRRWHRRQISPLAKRRMIVLSALLLLGLAAWAWVTSPLAEPYVGAFMPYYDQAVAATNKVLNMERSDLLIAAAAVIIPHIGMIFAIFELDGR